MATTKQVEAAKRNVKHAQKAARQKRTIANLPKSTRRGLGQQAARARGRGGKPGRALEDRNQEQLYKLAKEKGISGRSKMGKWDLIEAMTTFEPEPERPAPEPPDTLPGGDPDVTPPEPDTLPEEPDVDVPDPQPDRI